MWPIARTALINQCSNEEVGQVRRPFSFRHFEMQLEK